MAWCKRHCLAILEGLAARKAVTAVATSMLTRNWKKETKNISIFSEFIRRNSSTLASSAAEEIKKKGIMEEESLKHKSLYLCFVDSTCDRKHIQVIRSIKLSHLLEPPVHGGDDLKLQNVASRCGPDTVVPQPGSTGVIGSKIIFLGGFVVVEMEKSNDFSLSKEVSLFETDLRIDPNPKLQPSQVFKISRAGPVLVEVDNKLYRFDSQCDCESFEVFEAIQDEWLPLDVPPRKYPYGFIHAIAGTNILLWGRNQNGVYMFDVTHSKKGWTQLDPCMGRYIQSIDGYDQLFVKLKSSHGDGGGFLMFSINLKQSHTVLVSHMSQTCDSLKPLEPLQLPAETKRPPKIKRDRCRFFHLGGQKVGLVFSNDCLNDYDKASYVDYYVYSSDYDSDGEKEDGDEENKDDCHNNDVFSSDYDNDGENKDGDDENKDDYLNNNENGSSCNVINQDPYDSDKTSVLVIIFEYEFVEESMNIIYKSLTSHCLEYSAKDLEEESPTEFSILIGAHVL